MRSWPSSARTMRKRSRGRGAGPSEVLAAEAEATAVAGALELLVGGLPVGDAPQVRAGGAQGKHALHARTPRVGVRQRAHKPHALIELEAFVHTHAVAGREAPLEGRGRLEQHVGEEKPHHPEQAELGRSDEQQPGNDDVTEQAAPGHTLRVHVSQSLLRCFTGGHNVSLWSSTLRVGIQRCQGVQGSVPHFR